MKRGAVIPVVTALSVSIGTALFLALGQSGAVPEGASSELDTRPLYSDAFMWGGPCTQEISADAPPFACSRDVPSPDGRWRFILDNYLFEENDESYRVYVTDGDRDLIPPDLDNGFPFAMAWSPRPNWFFVDHHQGSGMQAVRVFEIAADGIVEHTEFYEPAQDAYAELFPCLDNPDWQWTNGNVWGWSRDGRYLAWTMMTRLDVCMEPGESGGVPPEKQVSPVSVISNLDTGELVEGSVRVLDWDNWVMPTDGPYAQIIRPGE